jgi:hypothetical protein
MGDPASLAAAMRDVRGAEADLAQSLAKVHRQRRFTVDAAYAYARRRDTDRGWHRAADLLELAVAERDRRAYRAPPMWTRLETGVGGLAIFAVVNAGVRIWYFGGEALWYPGTWWWLLYPVIWWYAVRRNPEALRAVAANPGEIERRLGQVLEVGRELADEGASPSELAAGMRRVAGGDGDALQARMAAVVLSRVQRRLAPTLERHRKILMEAADHARREQLQLIGLGET